MYLTNAKPRPRSSKLKELIRIVSKTHAPKSATFKRDNMYGVRRRLIRKLQERPSTLKNVLATNFLEKSPRSRPFMTFWRIVQRIYVSCGAGERDRAMNGGRTE